MSGAWREWEGQVVGGGVPLQRFLGSGEQSATFLTGYGEPSSGNAVVKLVRVEPNNAEAQLAQWERAARLSHPHLVRIFQFGTCRPGSEGLLYVVMEYGEENLAEVLQERPFTEVEAREMLAPVVDALAYIHGEGLVHGRLKPSNILAVGEQVKISSDGICQLGEAEGVSPQRDVWSLGRTLVAAFVRREELPAALQVIADRCLEADPRRRATVGEIAARLRQRPPVPDEQEPVEPREASRTWPYALAAGTAGLALAAVLARPVLLRRPAPPPVVEQPKAPQPAAPKPAQPEARPVVESASAVKKPSASGAANRSVPTPAPAAKASAGSGPVVHQVLPDITRQARDTIHGTVKIGVRAGVDPSGNVVSAGLDSPGPSKYFAALALKAARQWKFRPPQVDGEGVGSEWLLHFDITRTGTNVRPERLSP